MRVEPVILEGGRVRLEPLQTEHLVGLCAVGLDSTLWKLSPSQITDREAMAKYVADALAEQEREVSLPFVTRLQSDGQIVGSTRFGNIDIVNRKVEIGWTWITPDWQRTFVNTEAKLLMLTHAFEVWNCIRVEFKTDVLNDRSRNGILRLGARAEGVHRNHMITDSGRFRDSIFFSIIETEWGEVKEKLTAKLRSSELG